MLLPSIRQNKSKLVKKKTETEKVVNVSVPVIIQARSMTYYTIHTRFFLHKQKVQTNASIRRNSLHNEFHFGNHDVMFREKQLCSPN